VNEFHLDLLRWLAAGTQPTPWVLSIAIGLALGGAWLSAAIIGAAAWRRPGNWTYAFFVLAAAGPCAMLSHAIALRLDQPRPFVLGLAQAYIEHAGRGSLPSTHASVMFMVAAACLLRPSLRRVGLALLASAIVTGWARIYVGVHFPLDIAAGLMFGALMAGLLGAAWWMLELGTRRLVGRMPSLSGKRWPTMPRSRA
jgi:membrane-associated phospholipid phosphatase